MPRLVLILAVCLLCLLGAAGCSEPSASDAGASSADSSSTNPALTLASKVGQQCEISYNDVKEPTYSEGKIESVSDQWIVVKGVFNGQTVNGVQQTKEMWIPTSKVLSISFDPAAPGT